MAVSVVQAATATVTGTAVTATFGTAVTPGNTICASVGVQDGHTAAFTVALTFGSSPDNWLLHRKAARSAAGSNIYTAQWADANTAISGTSTVTVTLSGASGGFETSVLLAVYEVAGLPGATEDITGATSGNSSAFTTGTFTPHSSTTAADEFWWGSVTCPSATTVTPPGSPWTNTATLTTGLGQAMVSGYQAASAMGTPVYSGSFSSTVQWACAGVTLKSGSAAGAASLAGHGTLGAAGGIAGAASLAGEGDLTAEAEAAPPGTAPLIGAGTLAATPTVSIEAAAALAGTGTLSAVSTAGQPAVVNQWAGSVTQKPVFGPSLPGLASVVVPLTHATSVGGGSGIPTAGNWLFAVCGWRQPPGGNPATISVGDDTHAWWRPAAPSAATGNTRTTIWYTPAIGQVTVNPSFIYVAPNAYVAGMAVLIIEVAQLGSWDQVAGMAVNYAASTTTLTLAVTL